MFDLAWLEGVQVEDAVYGLFDGGDHIKSFEAFRYFFSSESSRNAPAYPALRSSGTFAGLT
jgi:hypothetical protein